MMTCHSYSQLLIASLCLVITVTGQHTPFKVGIGVENGVELTAVCTEDENAFIKKTIQKYIIGLGRLFFRDETFELPHPLQDLDGSHFAAEAFSDFNAYEVEKYGGAGVGGEVQVSVTDRPSYSPAPSATPSQIPLEVYVHLDDTDAPVATPTTTVEAVSVKSAIGAEAPETIAPITPEIPVTQAPVLSKNIVSAADAEITTAATTGVVEDPVLLSNGISLPCCGWSGDGCSAPESIWCHEEEGRCLGECNGSWYSGNGQNVSTAVPSLFPTSSPSASPTTSSPSALPTASPSNVPTAPPTASPTTSQPSSSPSVSPSVCEDECVMLDFEKYPDGSNVNRGDYVSNDWSEYGVTFEAVAYTGGYTPIKDGLKEARIFDSSNPIGDADLGSPNQMCRGGGPGIGEGGIPGAAGENCVPVGNVLIIQQSQTTDPNDNTDGGDLFFNFDEPVNFNNMGFIDMDAKKLSTITVTTTDGSQHVITIPALGSNSVQTVLIPHVQVVAIKVKITAAAITHLSWCKASCAGSVTSGGRRQLESSVESNLRGLRGRRSPASFLAEDSITATTTEDIPATRDADFPERRELLVVGFKFIYGGQGEYTCYLCNPDDFERRHLLFTRKFLVSSLETIMSFGLTADMKWNYKDFLNARNETMGCLGNGDGIRVVMELTAVRPVSDL